MQTSYSGFDEHFSNAEESVEVFAFTAYGYGVAYMYYILNILEENAE